MKTYAFIDASNIIYGTRDEGWKVDFKKFYKYLSERFESRKIYYFAGEEKDNQKQQRFYRFLGKIGYELVLKPVKIYHQNDHIVRKANCDVDLTFYAMRDLDKFDRVIFLSGDGDFEILLKHFLKLKKRLVLIANGKRTAKEIKTLLGPNFTPLKSLQQILRYKKG